MCEGEGVGPLLGRVCGGEVVLEDVTCGYGRTEVLHGASVRFPAGKVSVIVGPNGCGKSTLVGCVARGLSVRAGRVLVGGVDVARLGGRARARLVAAMPQAATPPDMEVERLVLGGRYPHRGAFGRTTEVDRAVVRAAMEQAGCGHLAGRNVRGLSGGERQRVYLALALAQRAGVVVLDEPTAYLDPAACFELVEVVTRLKELGATVVMVLHDLPLAFSCADRIAVMRVGRVEAFGTPDEIAADGAADRVFGTRLRAVPLGEDDGASRRAWCVLPGA